MGKPGKVSVKGKGETDWGEAKSAQINLSITPTGRRELDKLVKHLNISRAEVLERVGRCVPIPYPMSCNSLEQLIVRNWDRLVEYGRIPVKRLGSIRDGAKPTALEITRIAIACGTNEIEIEQVISRGKTNSSESKTE